MICVNPSVSIVIPCRNEAAFIADCLDSILANDYPKDRLEIVVVDGMSEDKTREVLQRYTEHCPNMRLLNNPKKIIPAAMNIGVMQSQGELVLKMDAHCIYPADYIASCVRHLLEFNADMTGGVWTIATRRNSLVAQSIAVALSHWFASGNAYVKIGSKHPRWADAAAFGCWKRETMKKLGLFNEDLAGSSDMDFNMRLRKCGGKILLVPDIKVTYYADPDLMTFWKHNLSDGVWVTYVLKFRSQAFSWRHWIPMAFVSTVMGAVLALPFAPAAYEVLVGIGGTYVATTILASIQLSVERKTLKYIGILPIIFVIRHFAHGIGALYGIVLAVVPGLAWRGRRAANVH